jgi:hypothetical protein
MFDSNEQIDVFLRDATNADDTSRYAPNPKIYKVINTSTGAIKTYTGDNENRLFWPKLMHDLYIFGVYPVGSVSWNNVVDNTNPTHANYNPFSDTQNYYFTVQEDQTSEANYKASDLMVGEPTSKPVYRTTSNVTLQFKHCLSKININIKVGEGVDANELVGARVTIYTETNDATFDVQSGVITAVGSQGQAASPFVTVGDLTASGHGFEGMSAIIIPQDISAGSHFISIATNNQTTYRYNLPNTVNLISFESGKAYTYNLTVRKSGLTLDNTNITNWDDGGSVDGDAFQS